MSPRLACGVRKSRFSGTRGDWDRRYRAGGSSGSRSYGRLACFKAEVLNGYVRSRGTRSVVELGCGDGHQLSIAEYPEYTRLDIFPQAVSLCRDRFAGDATKQFLLLGPITASPELLRADLVLSLDVIFHLVEEDVYQAYMSRPFGAASRGAGRPVGAGMASAPCTHPLYSNSAKI